jgi:hypothetical protein
MRLCLLRGKVVVHPAALYLPMTWSLCSWSMDSSAPRASVMLLNGAAYKTIWSLRAASADLVHAAEVGAGGFVLLAAAIAVALRADWPLAAVGRALQWLRNRLSARHRPPVTGLDTRLLADRDSIRQMLGREWRQAVLLTAGRVGCDFGCLLAALTATGARPHPSLCCWRTQPRTLLPCSPSPLAGWASSKPASPACSSWPASALARRSWPPSPTGWPRTGFRLPRESQPMPCSGTATGRQGSGLPPPRGTRGARQAS